MAVLSVKSNKILAHVPHTPHNKTKRGAWSVCGTWGGRWQLRRRLMKLFYCLASHYVRHATQCSVPELGGNGQLNSGKCGPDTRHGVDVVARQQHGMKWQVECCKPIGISSIITVTK